MRGIKNILQSYALPTKHQDYSQINLLVEKLEGSLTCEDKLATLSRLYELISQDAAAKSTFSSLAFPIFCRLLREEASNSAIVRASLECVVAAVCACDGMSQQELRAIGVNAEQFARTKGAIDLLFWLQEATSCQGSDGIYITHLSLDILHSLFLANTALIQESIMAVPTSVSQLIALLNRQEVLRDNALLVLAKLVRGNVDAQKSAVQNGCFEQLFVILRMEKYMSGTAIVMDVFRLLINLIVGNEPNQQLFMKSGYADTLVSEIKSSLDFITSSFPPKLASAETADFIGLALEVVMACNSDQLTERIIPMVRKLVLSGPLNSQLTVVLWRILTHSLMMNLDIGLENQKDAHYMITLAFQGYFSYSSAVERHAASNFLAVALEKINSRSYDPLEIIMKSLSELKLFEKLNSFDLESLLASSRFAAAMAIFLLNNQDLKHKLLELSPSTSSSQNLVQLFTGQLARSILQYGTTKEAEEMAANFCAIFLAWLPKSANAIAQFLDQLRNAPFLVGSLLSADKFGSSAVVIQGVCSVLLGICCLYAPPDAAVSPSILIEAINNQVGWERYLDQLHNFIVISEGGPMVNVPIWPDMSCGKLRSVLEMTHKEMRKLSPFAVDNSTTEHEENRVSLSSVAGIESLNRPPRNDINHMEIENLELKEMLSNTQIENERLQEELNAVRASEERLRAALAKAEADLEGLSKAYTALDSHAEELRVKLDASESRNQDHSATIASGPTTSKDDETALEDLLVCLALEEAKVARLERELALLKGAHV